MQDLGSTNGTLVNGKLAREVKLEPGAEITIGSTRLVLFVGEESPNTESTDSGVAESHLHIAWLLDEELVEVRGGADSTRSDADVIGQDLRMPPNVKAVLEVISGQDVGKLYRFVRGNVSIGRRFGEVPLSDAEVSKRHAVLELFGREMIFLRDLGSTNGTYHNGRRITSAKLGNGDTIGCGKTVMRLQLTF
jgi:pSer/pThr/pTyr-binding forkhead associated (FHA) protein